ncbi:MAG: chemotaxis protein CheW [Bacteroidales bacterium]|nr:chemotaxis protein CheW [Bacteroidales bacterium]
MEEQNKTSGKDQTSTINWEKIHSLVDSAGEKNKHGWEPSDEEVRKIFAARTKDLAKKKKKEKQSSEYLEVAEFILADERYGIESFHIVEVYPLKDLTPLPSTPPFIMGIINVRGQIKTVIDIKKFFDLPDMGLSDLSKVIIVRVGEIEVGFLADVSKGISSIPLNRIQPSLPTLTDIGAEYLKGITSDHLIILDVEKILSDKKIIINEEIM